MKSSIGYLLAPIVGYLVAQTLKYVFKQDRTWRDMVRSGSMPSSHTAVVTALAAAIYFHEGLSDLLAVAVTVMMLTIYDALVARRSIGEQGQALVRLLKKSSDQKIPLPLVALGHKPLEVVAGLAVGIVVGASVAFFITN